MSECPRGFHHVNHVCPWARPRRTYQMKYGTNNATHSTSAIVIAVHISIAQLLRMPISPTLLSCKRESRSRARLRSYARAAISGGGAELQLKRAVPDDAAAGVREAEGQSPAV